MTYAQIDTNLRRGGEIFIYSLWIQSQMTDLIILNDHPRIIRKFVDYPKTIPPTLRNNRMKYWRKSFGYIKKEFIKRFNNSLSDQALQDLNTVYFIRNAIGHSYVSLARHYFLYRPDSRRKLIAFKKSFDVVNQSADAAKPIVFKFDFSNDEIYIHNYDAIKRLDEVHLRTLAVALNIPHSRIR